MNEKNKDTLITLVVLTAIILTIVGIVQNAYSDKSTIREAARDVNTIGNDKYCKTIENTTSTLQRQTFTRSCT